MIENSELREHTHGLLVHTAELLHGDFAPWLPKAVNAALASCAQVRLGFLAFTISFQYMDIRAYHALAIIINEPQRLRLTYSSVFALPHVPSPLTACDMPLLKKHICQEHGAQACTWLIRLLRTSC